MKETPVHIMIAVHPAVGPHARQWVTAQAMDGDAVTMGFLRPHGEAVAAHASTQDWPLIGVRADAVRALGLLLASWGARVADSPDDEGEPW